MNTHYVSAIELVTVVFYWFQAMICVEYGEHTLRVSCRVNADEGEAEMLAVQYMWGVLGLVLYPIHTRLQDWPALLYMVSNYVVQTQQI